MIPGGPLRACIGACGSGKSYHLAKMVDEDMRYGRGPFLVLDLSAADWPGGPLKNRRFARVRSVEGAAAALGSGEALVIVSPAEVGTDAAAELGAELADLALVFGDGCTLVLPEAHTVAPERGGKLPDPLEQMAHRWRHRNVRMWVDTQYPQYIAKRLLRACHTWYWFATSTGNEVNAARERDPDLVADIRRVAELSSEHGAIVRPGWHVSIPTLTPWQREIVSPSGRRYSPEEAAKL